MGWSQGEINAHLETLMSPSVSFLKAFFHTIELPSSLTCPSGVTVLRETPPNTGSRFIYQGPTGVGDRVVQALHAFPSPSSVKMNPNFWANHGITRSLRSLVGCLAIKTGCSRHRSPQSPSMRRHRSSHSTTAFMVPRRTISGEVQLHPQRIAYFEVEIFSYPDGGHQDEAMAPRDTRESAPPQRSECIAVGLSAVPFPKEGFMPGWTCKSFGYHSDDGGLFHSSGRMLRSYGPHFGAGDIVGCGINYLAGGMGADIFFTLNGKFLGVAFYGVMDQLFPVVGIDAHVALQFNFGANKPFVFDLDDFEQSQIQSWNRTSGMVKTSAEAQWFKPPTLPALLAESMLLVPESRLDDGTMMRSGDFEEDDDEPGLSESYISPYFYRESSHRLQQLGESNWVDYTAAGPMRLVSV